MCSPRDDFIPVFSTGMKTLCPIGVRQKHLGSHRDLIFAPGWSWLPSSWGEIFHVNEKLILFWDELTPGWNSPWFSCKHSLRYKCSCPIFEKKKCFSSATLYAGKCAVSLTLQCKWKIFAFIMWLNWSMLKSCLIGSLSSANVFLCGWLVRCALGRYWSRCVLEVYGLSWRQGPKTSKKRNSTDIFPIWTSR